jgi:hypothetical protein
MDYWRRWRPARTNACQEADATTLSLMSNRPILCLDFDGVLHSYSSGWQGADVIPDPPVPGAIAFLREAVEHFTVAIYSSRSHQPGGQDAMRAWLEQSAADDDPTGDRSFLERIKWPLEKPGAFVTLDDRALTFTGEWPTMSALKAFRPWHKRAPKGAREV